MATATKAPAFDGTIRRYAAGYGSPESWAAARAAASGTDTYLTSDPASACYSDATLALINRGFLTFDTSDLPDNMVATAAKLKLRGTSVVGTVGAVCLVASNQASPTTLATSDYSLVGTTEFASRINISSWNTSGYNEFTLNAAGLAAINATGYTKFALRHSSDLDNSSPASPAAASYYPVERTGTSEDPVLEITYALTGAGADSLTWTDSGAVAQAGGSPIITWSRTGADSLTWTDTTPSTTPPARTAGTERTVFASGGTWHYQFPSMVRLPSGRQLCMARKSGTGHSVSDGVAVLKYSDDDGASWSSETVVTVLQAGQDDYRAGNMQVLAGGRVGHTFFTADANTPVNSIRGWYSYSDDSGVTWSTPVQIDTAAWDEAAFVAADLVQLPSGRIVVAGFGRPTFASSQWSCATVYSDDDGATWADLGTIAAYATYGYNVVEPQIERLETGKLVVTFHTEDSVPTNFYVTNSTDGGATWATPTLVTGTSYNRQGIATANYDRNVLIAYSSDGISFTYLESGNYGVSYPTSGVISPWLDHGGSGSEGNITWCMPTQLAGNGISQNVGFVYSFENASQTRGSVFYKPFSGLDGLFINPRSAADALTWTDTGAVTQRTFARTGADSLTWTDAGARGAQTFARTGADTLTWTDTGVGVASVATGGADTVVWTDGAAGISAKARTGADTIAWSDTATRTTPRTRLGADTLTWTDTALGSASSTNTAGADTITWSDSASGTVTDGVPRAPYTLTGTSRARITAGGASRPHARLTGGPTP